jgi:hypothetical protein
MGAGKNFEKVTGGLLRSSFCGHFALLRYPVLLEATCSDLPNVVGVPELVRTLCAPLTWAVKTVFGENADRPCRLP